MNNTTEEVTIMAVFISDIIDLFAEKTDFQYLKRMTFGYDLSDGTRHVPIEIYNHMCDWIETELGKNNAILIGRRIGERIYQNMLSNNMVNPDSAAIQVMKALTKLSLVIIYDPERRGWEIVKDQPKLIVLKRTQTFNSTVQIGLLDTLLRKAGVLFPSVHMIKKTSRGDEFDEYQLTWH